MDLRQLNYFIAVAEERHLGRAAARLHLSQPPLTRQIQALEEDLGVKLFIRTARGMVLTQAGETLLKDARSVRGMVELAAERAHRAGRGQVGRLDVGVYGSSIFGVVPRVLTRFTATHPDVQLALHHAQAVEQLAALRQGRVLAVFERWLPEEPDVDVQLLAREPLLVALPATHALAERKKVPITALRDETLIVGMAPTILAAMLALCRTHGFEPRLAPPASDIVMAALQASLGLGVALVPDSMAHVHFPGIAYRPLTPAASLDVFCYCLRSEDSPLLQALRETVRAFADGRNEATLG
jgi:DNA-binding transcriptional LysR family regulator